MHCRQGNMEGYTAATLNEALSDIRQGKFSIRAASINYNIPRTTLQDKLSGRRPEGVGKRGPESILTEAEEKKLVKWCESLAKCGFPLSPDGLLNTVQKIVQDDGRTTSFKNGRPGRKWFNLFLKRNPELAHRIPEGLTKARAAVSEEGIRKWFDELHNYIKEMNAEDIFLDPRRVLNGDETSFSLCPKTGKVLAPKGFQNVYKIQPGSEKETITVLLVFTASGETVVPMVVFPYVRPPRDVVNSIPEDWFLGRSESGWMRSEVFFEYIANGVNAWLINEKIRKPVILFVDGHKSHLTLELSEFCSANGIILYALPPNTTHMLQPADVSVFKPLKTEWKKTIREWQCKAENVNRNLTKSTFCPLLASILKIPTLPLSIKNGFRKCGLYPINPDAVDYTKCIRDNLQRLVRETKDNSSDTREKSIYDIAEEVIAKIKPRLLKHGIDSDVIIKEIQNEKNGIDEIVVEEQTTTIPISNLSNECLESLDVGSYVLEEDGSLTKEIQSIDMSTPAMDQDTGRTDNAPNLQNMLNEILGDPCTSSDTNTRFVYLGPPTSTSIARKSSSTSCSPVVSKHLTLPSQKHIYSKLRKPEEKKEKIPCAISSVKWQEMVKGKVEAKKRKIEDIEKRKQERLTRKKERESLIAKKKKGKENVKEKSGKESCAYCAEELVSDVEDESLKNVGCDECLRWFHLKCTHFRSYNEAIGSIFTCMYCS